MFLPACTTGINWVWVCGENYSWHPDDPAAEFIGPQRPANSNLLVIPAPSPSPSFIRQWEGEKGIEGRSPEMRADGKIRRGKGTWRQIRGVCRPRWAPLTSQRVCLLFHFWGNSFFLEAHARPSGVSITHNPTWARQPHLENDAISWPDKYTTHWRQENPHRPRQQWQHTHKHTHTQEVVKSQEPHTGN